MSSLSTQSITPRVGVWFWVWSRSQRPGFLLPESDSHKKQGLHILGMCSDVLSFSNVEKFVEQVQGQLRALLSRPWATCVRWSTNGSLESPVVVVDSHLEERNRYDEVFGHRI